jgi:hypothetical protein
VVKEGATMRAIRLFCCFLAGLLVAAADPGEARVLAGATLPDGGWNQVDTPESLVLPASFGRASRGAFCFDLLRTGDAPYTQAETVFELVDARGERVLRVKASWSSDADRGAHPTLLFQGEGAGGDFRRHGVGLWGPVIELDRAVAVGESVHVDLTWDDSSRAYAAYADGRPLTAWHGGFDPAQKRWYPDPRATAERGAGGRGQSDAQPLGFFLARVAAVHLGAYDDPGRAPARPRSLLRNGRLTSFAAFVDEVPAPGGAPAPTIAAVEHDAFRTSGFSGKLVAGDALEVTLQGTPGATGSFDVVHYPDLGGVIALDWRGWGVGPEQRPVPEAGEVDVADVTGYRVFASTAPFDPAAPGLEPVARLATGEQSYTLQLLEADRPYYVAVVADLRGGGERPVIAPIRDQPLAEGAPGVYTGTFRVGWRDRLARAAVVGRLARGTAAATLVAARTLALDPALTVAVETEPKVLRADERSAAQVSVTVTDANGRGIAGHKIGLLLATTSRYTGVGGGGAFADQVGGSLAGAARGETDLFGKLTTSYVAGFAAKTAIIVARDLTSDDTGAGWVQTYIQATAGLELEPVGESAAAGEGYAISVSSSDDWLTADGRSQARITARVTLNGEPVAGRAVGFACTSGMGSLRVTRGETDRSGEARAVYTAGVKRGLVIVTATDVAAGISGSVPIELRSDAPAKIAVRVDPERLPADGNSRAEVLVEVTDVNDNASEQVEVAYRLASGDGRLRDESGVTDRNGRSAAAYQAGRRPGPVAIEVTVRSPVPTAGELAAARGLAVAPPETD